MQQHDNGHNRTLNCTLCKINMVLAAPTPGRLSNERVGGYPREKEEEEALATSVAAYLIQGLRHYFHGCPLRAQRPASCDRITLTAMTAQSSFFFYLY